ncbi:MAG: transposase [Alphaproteobacteria bacterium]|nr:transposase [Alphaproteobacteria bacterium]
MRKPRLPESKIKEILAEQAAGAPVGDIVKKHKISPATFYNWKTKYGSGDAAPAKRGRPKGSKNVRTAAPASVAAPAAAGGSLADENRRLKIRLVDLMLENERLKEMLGR